ncbi:class I SAM-dependent methyltransferase [Desulfovibrio inopinatus]|uniref:class I SAM-dependent methyltransferase n=1 Tax=Desulfovibrio inopinatus TaxID=102109 RepID=UPI0003FF5F5D|nr:class I SAM-dependent methyltransferase [Desulfovibrio inopinatus]
MTRCPLCQETMRQAYTHPNAFFADRDVNLPLVMEICPACGFLFQSSAATPEYEDVMNTGYGEYYGKDIFAFPRRDRESLKALDMLLRNLPDVPMPSLLEIGSNKGDLLYMVKEKRPECNVLGIDPGMSNDRGVPTVREYFRPELFASTFDVVILKHILEHFTDPKGFLQGVSRVLSDNGLLYVDVPNLNWILQDGTEGFVLHHVGYFTLNTLRIALEGFEVVEAEEEASLRAVFRKSSSPAPVTQEDVSGVAAQCALLEENRKKVMNRILTAAHNGTPLIFYGAYTIFRLLYREIRYQAPQAACSFYDDNYDGESEPVFGLKRCKELHQDALVILCSNNSETLDAMEQRLQGRNLNIVRPWRSHE